MPLHTQTGGNRPWSLTHSYATPGRYPLWLHASWQRWGRPEFGPRCASVTGVHKTLNLIDVLPAVNASNNGKIGLFYNPEGTLCAPAAPAAPLKRIYVVAKLDGASSNGINGAVFRLKPDHMGFFYNVLIPEGWIAIGDVFGDGVEMVSAACQGAASGYVTLMEILAFPTGEQRAYANLLVDPHLNPSNPNYQTSMFILCDAPTFTASPAGRGYLSLISTEEHTGPCSKSTVSVSERAQSDVKQFYRE